MDDEELRPSVTRLFNEIINMILIGDWEAFSSGEKEKYYVFGLDGFYRDQGMPLSDECRKNKPARIRFAPRLQKYVRSLIAEPRLVTVGIINEINEEELSRFFRESSLSEEMQNNLSPEQYDAVWHFYDALNTHRTNATEQIQRINELGIWEELDMYFRKIQKAVKAPNPTRST